MFHLGFRSHRMGYFNIFRTDSKFQRNMHNFYSDWGVLPENSLNNKNMCEHFMCTSTNKTWIPRDEAFRNRMPFDSTTGCDALVKAGLNSIKSLFLDS